MADASVSKTDEDKHLVRVRPPPSAHKHKDMADKIEVNCVVQQLGCNDPRHKWTERCDEAGKNYFLHAPDMQSAKGVVCVLAQKCRRCGHGPTPENLLVRPFPETIMMPASDTIYSHDKSNSCS